MTVVWQDRPDFYESLMIGFGSLTLSSFPDHLELHPAGSELHSSAVILLWPAHTVYTQSKVYM